MDVLSRLFQNKKDLSRILGGSAKINGGAGNRQWSEKKWVRLVIFTDHDIKGRCVVFDSKVQHPIEPQHLQAGCRKRGQRGNPGLLTPGRPPPDTGQGHGGAANKYTPLKHLSEHQTYAELMFGSVAMSYKGGTLKVHSLRGSTPQLMITSVFIPVKPQKESNCDQDTFDTHSLQSSVQSTSAENSAPKDILGAARSTSSVGIAQSVPVAVPMSPKSRSQENEDSGISGSMTDSYNSHNTSHNHPHSSPGSTTSATSNSFHMMQRRWLRNQNTSLERNLKHKSLDDMSDHTPGSKRPPKFGIGVIIGDREPGMEKCGDFVDFFFSHITLIETHIKKLKVEVEKAAAHNSKFTIIVHEAYEHLYDSLYHLYMAPRLKEPVWLNMMTYSTHKGILCKKFLREFMYMIEKFDSKGNKYFVSTLITAVLKQHLAWVPTVTPAGAAPSRTYLDKHSAKWLKTLSKSHPYNPLWAQLGDLYGAIGFPLRLSRTVVVGKKIDLVSRFLYILSYFIRSSQVYETSQSAIKFDQDDELEDENQGQGHPEMEPIKEAPSRRNSEHSQIEITTQNKVLFQDCSELHIDGMTDEMRTSAETVLTASSCQTDGTLQETPQICMCDMPDSASVENLLDDEGEGQPDSFHKVSCENVINFSIDVICANCGNVKLPDREHHAERTLKGDTEGYLAHCLEQGQQMVFPNKMVPETSDEVNLSRSMLLFRLLNPEKEVHGSEIEQHLQQPEINPCKGKDIDVLQGANTGLIRVPLNQQPDPHDPDDRPKDTATNEQKLCLENLDVKKSVNEEHSNEECQISPVLIKEDVPIQRIRHVGKSTFFAAVDCDEIINCPPEDKFRMDSSTFYVPSAKENISSRCCDTQNNDNTENTQNMCDDVFESRRQSRSRSTDLAGTDVDESSCDNRGFESSAVFSDFSQDTKSILGSKRSGLESNRDSGLESNRDFEESCTMESGIFDSKNSKFKNEGPSLKVKSSPLKLCNTSTKSRPLSEISLGNTCKHRKLRLGIERSNSIFDEYFIGDSTQVPESVNTMLKNIPMTQCRQTSDYQQDVIGFSKDYIPDLLPSKAELDQISTETQAGSEHNKTALVQRGTSQFDEYFSLDGKPIHLPDSQIIDNSTDTKTALDESDTIEHCSNSNKCLSNSDQQAEKCFSDSDVNESEYRLRSDSFSMRRRTNSRGSVYNRQNSTQSVPGRCRSVTPTELGRRRHRSNNSSQFDIDGLEWNLKDLPMPGHDDEEPDSPEPAGQFTQNFGSSLMAGYTPQYLPDFVLQGTSDNNIYPKLHTDLKMSVKNSVLDERIAETVCVVADVDKWSVKEVKCQFHNADRVSQSEVVMSQLVHDIIESVHSMWKLKMSPEFCLWHLEDRLQEVFFKSRTLAEYLRVNAMDNLRQLADDLEFSPTDLPLLFAVAGTHSPRMSMGLVDFPKI